MRTIEELEHKARRLLRREGPRKALRAYEDLTLELPESARHWAMFAGVLLCARRTDEALRAMRMSIWLRMKQGDYRRAASLARLLLRHVDEDRTAERALERCARAA